MDEKVIDLRNQKLKRIPQIPEALFNAEILLLDNNDISRLEQLSRLRFSDLKKFSAPHNIIFRMRPIELFRNLVHLDLSFNKIKLVEGLKYLSQLSFLNLSHNSIQSYDFSKHDLGKLRVLDLSHNKITYLGQTSELRALKTLNLENNAIAKLNYIYTYLPKDLECIGLSNNNINDITEFWYMYGLGLTNISVQGNPCADGAFQALGNNYRIYILCLLSKLQICDNIKFSDAERAQAEWLYSQGHGLQFRPGQHNELIEYLKIKLSDELQKYKIEHIIQRSQEIGTVFMPPIAGPPSPQMTRSLSPSIFKKENILSSAQGLSQSMICRPVSKSQVRKMCAGPLPAATKMVPVPESLVSPVVANIPDRPISVKKMIAEIETSKPVGSPNVVGLEKATDSSKTVNAPEVLEAPKAMDISKMKETRQGNDSRKIIKPSNPFSLGTLDIALQEADTGKPSTSHLSGTGGGFAKMIDIGKVEKPPTPYSLQSINKLAKARRNIEKDDPVSGTTTNISESHHLPLDNSTSTTQQSEITSLPIMLDKSPTIRSPDIPDLSSTLEKVVQYSEVLDSAAVIIQSHWRGYRVRRDLKEPSNKYYVASLRSLKITLDKVIANQQHYSSVCNRNFEAINKIWDHLRMFEERFKTIESNIREVREMHSKPTGLSAKSSGTSLYSTCPSTTNLQEEQPECPTVRPQTLQLPLRNSSKEEIFSDAQDSDIDELPNH